MFLIFPVAVLLVRTPAPSFYLEFLLPLFSWDRIPLLTIFSEKKKGPVSSGRDQEQPWPPYLFFFSRALEGVTFLGMYFVSTHGNPQELHSVLLVAVNPHPLSLLRSFFFFFFFPQLFPGSVFFAR